MITEIPQYGLRAYALFFTKYGISEDFKQNELDWSVSQSMKKKIFSLLLNSGWVEKTSRNTYRCREPKKILNGLVDFKVNEIIKNAEKTYAFTNLSAVEIWSDYSYVLRGLEKSPYFIKILKKDLAYWKSFFNKNNIPNYINKGSTIGEYVIFIPVKKLKYEEKFGLKVEPLSITMNIAKENNVYSYALEYMRKKYGRSAA
jgi:hypothetical protein